MEDDRQNEDGGDQPEMEDGLAADAEATSKEAHTKRVTHSDSKIVIPAPSGQSMAEPMEVFAQDPKKQARKKINDEVAEELYRRLAAEFVKTKIERLNFCSRLYLYL